LLFDRDTTIEVELIRYMFFEVSVSQVLSKKIVAHLKFTPLRFLIFNYFE
jgi:hypothetical protein